MVSGLAGETRNKIVAVIFGIKVSGVKKVTFLCASSVMKL